MKMHIIQLLKAKFVLENISQENVEHIFYVAGSQTLPPPLEAKEEERYILELEQENNIKARQTLVEHNLRLVVYIAKKFENTGVGIEDLISIGTIRIDESNQYL